MAKLSRLHPISGPAGGREIAKAPPPGKELEAKATERAKATEKAEAKRNPRRKSRWWYPGMIVPQRTMHRRDASSEF